MTLKNPLAIGVDSHGKTFALPLETVTATIAILAAQGGDRPRWPRHQARGDATLPHLLAEHRG